MSQSQAIAKYHHLWLMVRSLGGGLLADSQSRPWDHAAYRDYSPGDDHRLIDWNICARHDELRVRRREIQTPRHVHLLIDCSASMTLGQPAKFDVARRVAAALGYLALAEHASVEAWAMSGRIVAHLPPITDRRNVLQLVRFLDTLTAAERRAEFFAVVPEFLAKRPRVGPCVLLTDAYDPDYRSGLDRLRRAGCSPRVVQLYQPSDMVPPPIGDTELVDVESGRVWRWAMTPQHRADYARRFADYQRALHDYCAAYRLRCVQIPVTLPEDELLWRAASGVSPRSVTYAKESEPCRSSR